MKLLAPPTVLPKEQVDVSILRKGSYVWLELCGYEGFLDLVKVLFGSNV